MTRKDALKLKIGTEVVWKATGIQFRVTEVSEYDDKTVAIRGDNVYGRQLLLFHKEIRLKVEKKK